MCPISVLQVGPEVPPIGCCFNLSALGVGRAAHVGFDLLVIGAKCVTVLRAVVASHHLFEYLSCSL